MKRPLGCLSGVGLIAALLALLVVGGIVAATGGVIFSPGKLNAQGDGETFGGVASHAELGGDCAACHTAPWSTHGMADRCAACHTAMREPDSHLAQFHALLWGDGPAQRCRDCHPEHRGATAALTEMTVTDFPHERTGFSLAVHQDTGAGDAFACADCHTDNLAAFDVATCDACHARLDAAYMTAHTQDFGAQCLNCHDGADRFSGFDHSRTAFQLAGSHAEVRCGECHRATTAAEYAAAPTTCVDCHREDDAHAGQLGTDCAACHAPDGWENATFDHATTHFPLTGRHAEVDCAECHTDGRYAGTPTDCAGCHQEDDAHAGQLGTDCATCHTPDDWKDVTFDHASTAFPLAGKHVDVTCESCHASARFEDAPTDCVGCHQEDDAHAGQLGTDCATCHAPADWKDVTFDHASTAFPLQGKHADATCEGCHASARFEDAPTDCVGCHQEDDAHGGQFGTNCAGCHTPDDWRNATFDHAQTAFPLTGAHQQARCEQCHVGGRFEGTSAACASCHPEPDFHRGVFPQGCDACHATTAWLPARFDLPHTFPVNHGNGGGNACRACHPDALAAYTCYGCHEHDPAEMQEEHADEGIGDIANCARCHPTGQKDEAEREDD